MANRQDEALLQIGIPTGIDGIQQIIKCLEDGSVEVQNLLQHECAVIYECKACKNLFRSLPNFIAHKRTYCRTSCLNIIEAVAERVTPPAVDVGEGTELQPESGAERRSPAPNGKKMRQGNLQYATKSQFNLLKPLARRMEHVLALNEAGQPLLHLHSLPTMTKVVPTTDFVDGVQVIVDKAPEKEVPQAQRSDQRVLMVFPEDPGTRQSTTMTLRNKKPATSEQRPSVLETTGETCTVYQLLDRCNQRFDLQQNRCLLPECRAFERCFSSVELLAYHMCVDSSHVEGLTPASCLLCGKAFPTTKSVCYHVKAKHLTVGKQYQAEMDRLGCLKGVVVNKRSASRSRTATPNISPVVLELRVEPEETVSESVTPVLPIEESYPQTIDVLETMSVDDEHSEALTTTVMRNVVGSKRKWLAPPSSPWMGPFTGAEDVTQRVTGEDEPEPAKRNPRYMGHYLLNGLEDTELVECSACGKLYKTKGQLHNHRCSGKTAQHIRVITEPTVPASVSEQPKDRSSMRLQVMTPSVLQQALHEVRNELTAQQVLIFEKQQQNISGTTDLDSSTTVRQMTMRGGDRKSVLEKAVSRKKLVDDSVHGSSSTEESAKKKDKKKSSPIKSKLQKQSSLDDCDDRVMPDDVSTEEFDEGFEIESISIIVDSAGAIRHASPKKKQQKQIVLRDVKQIVTTRCNSGSFDEGNEDADITFRDSTEAFDDQMALIEEEDSLPVSMDFAVSPSKTFAQTASPKSLPSILRKTRRGLMLGAPTTKVFELGQLGATGTMMLRALTPPVSEIAIPLPLQAHSVQQMASGQTARMPPPLMRIADMQLQPTGEKVLRLPPPLKGAPQSQVCISAPSGIRQQSPVNTFSLSSGGAIKFIPASTVPIATPLPVKILPAERSKMVPVASQSTLSAPATMASSVRPSNGFRGSPLLAGEIKMIKFDGVSKPTLVLVPKNNASTADTSVAVPQSSSANEGDSSDVEVIGSVESLDSAGAAVSRKLKCKLCGTLFYMKNSFREHLKSCSKLCAFEREQYYQSWSQALELVDKVPMGPSSPTKRRMLHKNARLPLAKVMPRSKPRSSANAFCCAQCPGVPAFESLDHFKRHCVEIHPMSCKYCGYTATDPNAVRRHIKCCLKQPAAAQEGCTTSVMPVNEATQSSRQSMPTLTGTGRPGGAPVNNHYSNAVKEVGGFQFIPVLKEPTQPTIVAGSKSRSIASGIRAVVTLGSVNRRVDSQGRDESGAVPRTATSSPLEVDSNVASSTCTNPVPPLVDGAAVAEYDNASELTGNNFQQNKKSVLCEAFDAIP